MESRREMNILRKWSKWSKVIHARKVMLSKPSLPLLWYAWVMIETDCMHEWIVLPQSGVRKACRRRRSCGWSTRAGSFTVMSPLVLWASRPGRPPSCIWFLVRTSPSPTPKVRGMNMWKKEKPVLSSSSCLSHLSLHDDFLPSGKIYGFWRLLRLMTGRRESPRKCLSLQRNMNMEKFLPVYGLLGNRYPGSDRRWPYPLREFFCYSRPCSFSISVDFQGITGTL